VGLLIALGMTIVHYRTRRPILSLGAATAIVEPTDVVSVPERWRALGTLRHVLPPVLSASATSFASRRLRPDDGRVALSWPGTSSRRVTRLCEALGLEIDPDAERTVIVADPRSRVRDLEDALVDNGHQLTLLWLA
jgi:hypothetical protein